MVEKRKERQKVSFSEENASSLLQRYEPTTVLTLLQEVEHHADLKIDWNELVKKTSTGITNAREYQMLWRHLAYQDDLLDKFENGAQPLDDDSDIECELEAFPAPTNEALTEAEACVKVMIESGVQSESNILNGSTIEAPLTINIPSSQRGPSEILQPSCSTGGKNIIVPVAVQKFPLPPVPPMENLEANGLTGGNNISLRRKRKWSEEEDRQLMAAVKKWGEGNWAVIINKGEYDWGGRQSSHLSQRWATLRKKNTNLSIGKNSTGPKLTEAQMAARHAVSMALDMPVKSLKANGMPGHVSTKPVQSNTTVETSSGGDGPRHLSKQASSMSNLSPAVKSQPSSKKTMKFNRCPDSAVQATAVASGAGISSSLDAPSVTQAAEATSAVHIVRTGGTSARSPMPASGAAQSHTHPNQHCTYTSQTTTPVSSHTNTTCIPAAPLGSPSKASSLAVETTSAPVEVPKSEPKNEGIPMANEFHSKQVDTLQGREIHDLGCAPKEQRQGDEFSRRQDAEIEIIEENKAAPTSLEAECRSQEVVMNLASANNNVLAAKVVAINDNKMVSDVRNSDQNMNEQNASLPSTILDKCTAKQELPVNVDVAEEL